MGYGMRNGAPCGSYRQARAAFRGGCWNSYGRDYDSRDIDRRDHGDR